MPIYLIVIIYLYEYKDTEALVIVFPLRFLYFIGLYLNTSGCKKSLGGDFGNVLRAGRVRELLINSEKASASPIFEENVERFSCLRFSITHGHDLRAFNQEKTIRKRRFELQGVMTRNSLRIYNSKSVRKSKSDSLL